MDLLISKKTFIVCGASSGFGQAISKRLLQEGANIIAVGRDESKLKELVDGYCGKIETFQGDLTKSETIQNLLKLTEKTEISGILVNAGGPPALKFMETSISDWDKAYNQILRWKVELTKAFIPRFIQNKYGRFLYIESSSVKQPIENLILSTSLRLAVTGMVKTLSQEIQEKGITFNIMAPGYHNTPAIERLLDKKVKDEHLSKNAARKQMEEQLPMKKAGSPDYFASLAVWLLSPLSEYVTGQVYAVDGGVLKGTL
jgi:3-oxoacyl-[acyl-carrier protein] reductase